MKTEGGEEPAGSAIPVRGSRLHFGGNIRNLTGRIESFGGDHANLFPFMKLSTQTDGNYRSSVYTFRAGSLPGGRNDDVIAVDVKPIAVGRSIGEHLQRHRPF